MIINNNSVEQINVALLDLEKKLLTIKADKIAIGSLKDSINTIKASLNETKAGLTSGATYNINITGNATTATTATTAGSAVSAESAESAERASKDGNGNSITNTYATKNELTGIVPAYSTSDAGKNLAVNRDGTGTEWVKPQSSSQTVKFVDYRTESFTFSSLTDQKKIELSNFGPDVTENNVLSFMVIYWTGVPIIAQGGWAKSQGTGSSGLNCALHSLNNGTGYCVIRCVYLA